ncbi:MAG: GTPase [Pseudomonadota bacterium]
MRLETYIAPTLAEAMKEIRAELGGEAVMVAAESRTRAGVRVVAALEAPDPAPAARPAWLAAARSVTAMRPQEGGDRLASALAFHGVPLALATRLDAGKLGTTLATRLAGVFRFANLLDRRSATPVLIAGPPGAGKTLVVAKLAARAVFARRPVRVLTADMARAGGAGELAALTRILDVELSTADGPAALVACLAATRDDPGSLVLIDTPGINPHRAVELAELASLIAAAAADPVLVLPSGGDARESAETAQAFSAMGCTRLVVTRLDAARRLGGALAAANAGGLAFAEASATAAVAHGLMPLDPGRLAGFLMAEGPVVASQPAADLETIALRRAGPP